MKISDVVSKMAFVTRAASGIGRAMATMFAAFGVKVTCVDLDESGPETTVEEIEAAGGTAEVCASTCPAVPRWISPLDAAAAGIGWTSCAAGIPPTSFPRGRQMPTSIKIMPVNYMGSLYAARRALHTPARGLGGPLQAGPAR